MPNTFDDTNFKSEVLEKTGLVLVDFWAPWCGPCRMLAPILEELSTEVKDKVTVGKLNVDESPSIAGGYGIMSIPTVVLFKNGQPVEQIVGVRSKDVYLDIIDKHSS